MILVLIGSWVCPACARSFATLHVLTAGALDANEEYNLWETGSIHFSY